MNKFLLEILLVLPCLFFLAVDGRTEDVVAGHWGYFLKIYKGQDIPEGPEDTLRLRYELTAEGKSRLYWWHEGEHDHCERRGQYHLEGSLLVDETQWVDPENTNLCSQDPDMQEGKITKTPYSFREGNLVTRIPLGEEELFYVWKRIIE